MLRFGLYCAIAMVVIGFGGLLVGCAAKPERSPIEVSDDKSVTTVGSGILGVKVEITTVMHDGVKLIVSRSNNGGLDVIPFPK